jgi:hypothetical protein
MQRRRRQTYWIRGSWANHSIHECQLRQYEDQRIEYYDRGLLYIRLIV